MGQAVRQGPKELRVRAGMLEWVMEWMREYGSE